MFAVHGEVTVTPDSDQTLPINSPVNVTLVCNVSEDSNNTARTQAIWEVEDRQIQSGSTAAFEMIGIFIEQESVGVVRLIISREARLLYQDSGLMVRCTAFAAGEPPITVRGRAISIGTYGMKDSCFGVVVCYAVLFNDHLYRPA